MRSKTGAGGFSSANLALIIPANEGAQGAKHLRIQNAIGETKQLAKAHCFALPF